MCFLIIEHYKLYVYFTKIYNIRVVVFIQLHVCNNIFKAFGIKMYLKTNKNCLFYLDLIFYNKNFDCYLFYFIFSTTTDF